MRAEGADRNSSCRAQRGTSKGETQGNAKGRRACSCTGCTGRTGRTGWAHRPFRSGRGGHRTKGAGAHTSATAQGQSLSDVTRGCSEAAPFRGGTGARG